MKNIGNGNFSYLFNGSVWGRDVQLPYNFTIKINASLYGYQTVEQTRYIMVEPLPTNVTVYLNDTKTTYYIIDKNDTINITVYFENILRGTPIVDGFVNITCISNPSIADKFPMTSIGNGNYTWKFDPTSSGRFNFVINGTKVGHIMSSRQFTIVVGFTDIVTYLNGQKQSSIDIYYDEVVNITAFYNDTSIGSGITGASLNLTVLWNNTLYNMKELSDGNYTWFSDGNYTWLFNASQWYNSVELPYLFNIFINASKPSYQYAEKTISIRIINKPTNLTVYLNQTELNEITCYYDEVVNITVFYEDLINTEGITGASVNISSNSMSELGNGYYNWNYHAIQLGDFSFKINATKHGYEYNETTITIHVIERPTNITIYIAGGISYNYVMYYNESCLITGFFNDTIRNIGISSAVMKISNTTRSWTMNEVGNGNYTWRFNATRLGSFTFIINASKYGYKFNQTTINIQVIERPSEVVSYIGGFRTINYSLYYNQTCSVIIYYNDTRKSIGITNANTFINNTINSWKLKELGNGNYTWTFNATNVGIYQFSLNASKYGYQYSEINITIVVMPRPTDLGILINNSQITEYTLYYNQTYVITVNYTDVLTSNGIENASVKLNSTLFVELGNGIYELQFKADVIKNLTYIINATLNGNYTSVIRIIKINIIGRPITVELYINGELRSLDQLIINLKIGETLRITVKYKDNLTGQPIHGGELIVNNISVPENSSEIGRYDFIYTANDTGTHILNITITKTGFQLNSIIITIKTPPEEIDYIWIIVLLLILIIFGGTIATVLYMNKRKRPYAVYKKSGVEFILNKFNRALNLKYIIVFGDQKSLDKKNATKIFYGRSFEKITSDELKNILKEIRSWGPVEIDMLELSKLKDFDNIYSDINGIRAVIFTKMPEDNEFKNEFIKAVKGIEEISRSEVLNEDLIEDVIDLYFDIKIQYPYRLTSNQKLLSNITDKLEKLIITKIQEKINNIEESREPITKYITYYKSADIKKLLERFNALLNKFYRFKLERGQFYLIDLLPFILAEKKTSLESVLFGLINLRNRGILIPQINPENILKPPKGGRETRDDLDKKKNIQREEAGRKGKKEKDMKKEQEKERDIAKEKAKEKAKENASEVEKIEKNTQSNIETQELKEKSDKKKIEIEPESEGRNKTSTNLSDTFRMSESLGVGTDDEKLLKDIRAIIENIPSKFITKTKLAKQLDIDLKLLEDLLKKTNYRTTKTRVYREQN
ncbi:MAG: hypothetical protein ACTSRP_15255 [Candidatus Helarchaeota archaeon]